MNANVRVNLDKAKEIAKDFVRQARESKFKQADLDFMRAVEIDDATAKAAAVTYKQQLRDATSTDALVNASSLSEIKASWDYDLLGDSPYEIFEMDP